jgi:asparagine synthase (glutamine-hydrolysing)
MCGINGIALSSRARSPINERVLKQMRDVLTHRGPDDYGIFIDGNIGLGHRRLSIVDVAAGHQPMTNEDGSLQIVYNGEIYNHADYRAELEARGHVYRTHCDTETILHLYEENGPRVVESLRGMFAFAIWDKNKRQLFLARDRLGIKPLYYVHTDDGSLYFASEIKSLLAAQAVTPQINYPALPDYLANHATSGEETLFSGVKRLLPGHTMLWRDGQVRIEKYWDMNLAEEVEEAGRHRSDEDYIEEWIELFRTSVRLRLMADVPLGMFLSGGIDSSAIAAVMSEMVSEPIKTFSVAFDDRDANELEFARLVARTYKTDHHEVIVSPEDFFAALPKLVWHEDEPVAFPASVPLYFVSRLAQRHVKVVLTGEGSDELLGGYERYYKTVYNLRIGARYRQLTTAAMRDAVRRFIESRNPGSTFRRKLTRTFLCLPLDIESIYFDNFSVFSRAMQQDLLTPQTKERTGGIDPYATAIKYIGPTGNGSSLNRWLYADIKTYLHELLMKQDQMSMAASIESRVPFLDHRLVEFSMSLPERMKLHGLTTKYILRRAMQGILPDQILKRPKMGFPVPLASWFRGRFRSVIDEYVLSDRTLGRDIFDAAFVRRMVERHQSGAENHSERLWTFVNFEMWQRQFIDGEEMREPEQLAVAETAV